MLVRFPKGREIVHRIHSGFPIQRGTEYSNYGAQPSAYSEGLDHPW